MSEVDFAWAAGLFEGEGCITYSSNGRQRKKCVKIQVDSTDLDVLNKYKDIVGFGSIHGKNQPGTKTCYRWQSKSRKDIESLYLEFKPFLCERRTHRFEEVLYECTR